MLKKVLFAFALPAAVGGSAAFYSVLTAAAAAVPSRGGCAGCG